MLLIAAYLLLSLLAFVWIAWDTETIYIFDVFGKYFYYVWFQSGERWTSLFTYGWRLVALCSLVAINGLLSYRLFASNPLALGAAAKVVVFVAMLAGSFALIGWIYVAQLLRRRRWLCNKASHLNSLVSRILRDVDSVTFLASADDDDYDTDEPWTAWHPKQDEWKSNDCWSDIIPLVFVRRDAEPSVIFSVDLQSFLAWNVPDVAVQPGELFPFRGPFGVLPKS